MEYNSKLNWKIYRDKFYSELFIEYGWDYIVEAGFFYDDSVNIISDTDLYNLQLLCTPVDFIKKPETNKHCILLTTGSMCPLHEGHIEMMNKAKEEAIKNGYEVLGGYISPDHDGYVGVKTNNYMNAYERCSYGYDLIKEKGLNDWLNIDSWNSIFAPVALNFTDVYLRLELYLKYKFKINTEIIFVCGGDNARFCLTFKNDGKCIIVDRPGYDSSKYKTQTNTIIAFNDNNLSSTSIRKNSVDIKTNKKLDLNLRNDGSPYPKFINDYYNSVKIHNLDEQLEKAIKLDYEKNIISLDPLVKLSNNFRLSRTYDLFGHNKLFYWSGLSELNINSDKTYYLYDDDIHTGNTMQMAKDIMDEYYNIKIDGFISFNITINENTEVLDMRDFLAFGNNNGLTIKINYEIQRAVYAYPYVDPFRRCSVNNPLQFSIDVWEHNCEYFKDSLDTLDMYPEQIHLYKTVGFSNSEKIIDICKWHLNKLLEVKNNIYSKKI